MRAREGGRGDQELAATIESEEVSVAWSPSRRRPQATFCEDFIRENGVGNVFGVQETAADAVVVVVAQTTANV